MYQHSLISLLHPLHSPFLYHFCSECMGSAFSTCLHVGVCPLQSIFHLSLSLVPHHSLSLVRLPSTQLLCILHLSILFPASIHAATLAHEPAGMAAWVAVCWILLLLVVNCPKKSSAIMPRDGHSMSACSHEIGTDPWFSPDTFPSAVACLCAIADVTLLYPFWR